MALEGVVVGACGLRIAPRRSHPGADAGLRVGPVAPVVPPGTTPTEARRGDGVVWRRHWVDPRRLVVDFLGLALVEVDMERGTVVFDRELEAEMEEHLLFDHVVPLVLACRGEVVLHGGVISLDGWGVVLIGPSGAGKSTLTALAWKQGWTVGGDDGAVLSPGDPPTVEPTYATVRLTPASADFLDLGAVATAPVVGKLRMADLDGRRFRQAAMPLRFIASLEPAPAGAEASFEPLDGVGSHAILFGSTFHAELSGHHLLPVIVEKLASIVEATTVGRLRVPRGLDGLISAEQVLRHRLAEDRQPDRRAPGPGRGEGTR